MVKLRNTFSFLVVLTLLILLAPVAISPPGQNVSAAGEAVTEEIEAGFSFSVDSGGDWYSFTLGSGGVQGTPPRLAMVQYTRQNVILSGSDASLAGCGFRNYTTGSGTVTSTVGNLTGTMTLEWITTRFNTAYTHTPKYMTGTDFGWMAGRGHIDEGGGDSLTFVFIADLDCNDDMTTAAGKGFMQSVEENGRFGNMSNPIELRHHIIGDFDIALSGGTYTGNFSLRNYPPNEVYDTGELLVAGGVLQEHTDAITTGSLEICNMTLDGPMSTPADTTWPTGFEEIDWGRDPIKEIYSSDRMLGATGANATMGISRNTALYLNQSQRGGSGPIWVTIQGNPVCNLYVNDTNEGPRLNDGSAYGELYELLLLSLPQQELVVNQTVPNYFSQKGYTFCPFGTVNGQPTAQTGCYEGAESFADAIIYIQAVVGTAIQCSTDISYGLYPHPKVDTVFPSAGVAGTMMDVKISGKYFLRAAGEKSGFVPNSGSLDFGSGITVNSYSIKNSSPIKNEIVANITIAGGATAGSRNVNVTSCFGYNGTGAGNGTAPYKTGGKTGGFTVVGTGATLEGQFDFARKASAPSSQYITAVDVSLYETGNTCFVQPRKATTDDTGVFVLSGLAPGTYDIGVKNWTCMSKIERSVTLTDNATTVVDFGAMLEGDGNHGGTGGDRVGFDDYIDTLVNYNAVYWKADFDRSGLVGFDDYITVLVNYGQQGDIYKNPC